MTVACRPYAPFAVKWLSFPFVALGLGDLEVGQEIANAVLLAPRSCLQEDMQALIEERNEQDGHGEVSFRDDNGEYDADFEILMMEALHLASYETAWPLIKVSYETLSDYYR